jgi:hypothetical protein
MSQTPASRPPLGIPTGSVRALLTILIVTVVICQVVTGKGVEPLWAETLMIALAHYFTSRRFINLSPAVIQRLEEEGYVETEAHPLYLPRHSVRILLTIAFIVLTIYLYRMDHLFEPKSLSILGAFFAYLLGIVVRGILHWWTKGKPSKGIRGWEDVKAGVVLLVLGSTAGAYLWDRSDLAPSWLQNAALGLVLFYFGSR